MNNLVEDEYMHKYLIQPLLRKNDQIQHMEDKEWIHSVIINVDYQRN